MKKGPILSDPFFVCFVCDTLKVTWSIIYKINGLCYLVFS